MESIGRPITLLHPPPNLGGACPSTAPLRPDQRFPRNALHCQSSHSTIDIPELARGVLPNGHINNTLASQSIPKLLLEKF